MSRGPPRHMVPPNLHEHDALIDAYEHLNSLPRAPEALHTLRKLASLVKPIMRTRGWRVGTLTEFFPTEQNLLGLNVNGGRKICIRLRHAGDQQQFLPLEQVVDTMLHELSHNVHGPHDQHFHALWNSLRDEYDDLRLKGYSGEGFLSNGQRLGGRQIPMQEMRRQARVAAEQRHRLQKRSGQKLGGPPVNIGVDIRKVIADAATIRAAITTGCASGTREGEWAADVASKNGFRTQAEENDANERAIAQALWEMVQEEESRKLDVKGELWKTDGFVWTPESGLQEHGPSARPTSASESLLAANKPPTVFRVAPPATKIPLTFSQPNTSPSIRPQTSTRATRPTSRLAHGAAPVKTALSRSMEVKRPAQATIIDLSSSDDYDSSCNDHSNGTPPSTSFMWACPICTLANPRTFLICDACGIERPSSLIQGAPRRSTGSAIRALAQRPTRSTEPAKKLGWNCRSCGSFMESKWWTCSACGKMKASS